MLLRVFLKKLALSLLLATLPIIATSSLASTEYLPVICMIPAT